jgi:transcriptional regulator with XRE-family HTH domain
MVSGFGGVGRVIREARLRQGFSQAELSRQLGVEHQQISRWESEQDYPGRAEVAELARVLELSPDELEAIQHVGESVDTTSPVDESAEPTAVEAPEGDATDPPEPVESSEPAAGDEAAELLATQTAETENSEGGAEVPPPPPPPSSPSAEEVYRPTEGLAKALQLAFGLLIVLGALAVASSFAQYRLLSSLIDDPLSVSFDQAQSNDDRQSTLAVVKLLALIGVGTLFIVWTHRLYRNLPTLGKTQRFSSGWAIGAWFVPILNFWRPKQIIDEIWTTSEARGRPVPVLLHVWWGFWVASGLFGIFLRNRSASDLDAARSNALAILAQDVIWVIAAILALWVVARVSRHQEAYAASLTSEQHRDADGPGPAAPGSELSASTRRALAIGPAAIMVVVGLLAFVAWDVDTSDSESGPADQESDSEGDAADREPEAEPELVLAADLAVGDCFNDPGLALELPVVDCDEPHLAEVYAVHTPSGEVDEPSAAEIDTLASTVCLQRFTTFVGESYLASPLDYLYTNPTPAAWAGGDHTVTCSVYRPDGQDLVGSARNSGSAAGSIDLDEPQPLDELSLVGTAAVEDGQLWLTELVERTQRGAAWSDEKWPIEQGFETTFVFQIDMISWFTVGDGFAFVVQNTDPMALGKDGPAIGYGGLPNSVAVEFDTVRTGWLNDPRTTIPDAPDLLANQISVQTAGTEDNAAHNDFSRGWVDPNPVRLADRQAHVARIVYAPGEMTIYIDDLDTPVLEVDVDLADILRLDSGSAYVGFTAATSEFYSAFKILSWEYSPDSSNGASVATPTTREPPTPTTTEAPPVQTEFSDPFEEDLRSGWTWLSGDLASPDLTDMPGNLAMTPLSPGSVPREQILLREPLADDYEIETKLQFDPVANFQGAGLYVAGEGDNEVSVEWGYCDVGGPGDPCQGEGIFFSGLIDGAFGEGQRVDVPPGTTAVYLRLLHVGGRYTASFSLNGTSWTEIGSRDRTMSNPRIGLNKAEAQNPGSEPTAYFDYFSEKSTF